MLLLVKNKLWLYCNWASFSTWISRHGGWFLSLLLCSWSSPHTFLRHKTSISAKHHCRSHLLAKPLFLTNNLHLLLYQKYFHHLCNHAGMLFELVEGVGGKLYCPFSSFDLKKEKLDRIYWKHSIFNFWFDYLNSQAS